jgi:predicted transport protein
LPNIIEILKKIMVSYDFKIQEEFSDYFLAEKDNTNMACVVLPQAEDIKFADILEIKKKLPRDLDKIIMATPMDIHPELEKWVSQEGILLWDKKKLEEEIGRAVLSDAEGDLLKGKPKDEFPAETQIPLKKEDIPEIIMPPTMEEIDVKIETKDLPEEKESIVKPQITMSDVSEISKRIVQGFRFDLELVPYYIFDYSCELIVEGKATPQVSSGTLAINGLTNHAESWDFDFDTVSEVETTHTKLEPKFDENKAFIIAKESAITLNTREIQTVDDRGAVTIYEKKKVRPKEGAIDVRKRGLVYLPVWCVEGSNGVMIINATTGKVIREDIYRESDDVLPRSESRGFSF